MPSFVLTDTNILLRIADPAHPMYQTAADAVEVLRQRGDIPCLAPQNLIEYRAVCTRPVRDNGLGMDPQQIQIEFARLKRYFPVFEERPQVFAEWERLVDTYGAIGKQNHDARLVAAMNVHGIRAILTFNKRDFVRYPDLTVWEPKDLLATPST